MRKVLIAAVLSGLAAKATVAQEVAPPSGIERQIAALSDDSQTHAFELGMLTSLRAVEKTLQTRYEHGLGERIIGLPFLRMRFGSVNYTPKPAQPDTLTRMIETAMQDLKEARAILATAKGRVTPFELTLQDLWFDVNSDGRRDPEEGAIGLVGALLLNRNLTDDMIPAPATIRFDAADHAWLTAYTHMLSGMGSLFLAFDPAPVIADLEAQRAILSDAPELPVLFDADALEAEIQNLIQRRSELTDQISTLTARTRALRSELTKLTKTDPENTRRQSEINSELETLRDDDLAGLRREVALIGTQIGAAESKLPPRGPGIADQFGPGLDAAYILIASLRQQPDVSRIQAARAHFRAMIEENRAFWTALDAETDNDREWIPRPGQTSALPFTVDAEMIAAWQDILNDGEDLLEGRLLLPHPLIPGGRGISLAAYFDRPSPLGLLDWVHGVGAYRYAASGPRISRQRWVAFQRLTGGNAGGFALLFN